MRGSFLGAAVSVARRVAVAVEERRREAGDVGQLLGEMKAGQEARQIPARRGEGGLVEIVHVEIGAPVVAAERAEILEMESPQTQTSGASSSAVSSGQSRKKRCAVPRNK
jgi:hypothetical protein